jgi:hypothetical protein
MKKYLPKCSTSGRPASRDAQYINVAPNHDPRVPASTMPHSESGICPVAARCAAGGITISLGSGKSELSTAIISATIG